MKKSRQGFLKRQKELARQAKKKAKAERLSEARHKEGEEGALPDDLQEEGLDFHDLDKLPAAAVQAALAKQRAMAGGEEAGDVEDDEDGDEVDPDGVSKS